VKTVRNVVLKRLSATAERILYFNFVFMFAVVKIREVRIRTIIMSRLQEKIRRIGLIVSRRVDIHGTPLSLGLNILASK
jgi:hypothetical protein